MQLNNPGINAGAVDTKITTHAADPVAHQDAPGLIATHAALATVHQPGPIKRFFAAVTSGTNLDASGDYPAAICTGVAEQGYCSFAVPSDFVSISSAYVIVIARATQGAADWDIQSDYAAPNQPFNTHSEADAATTYNVQNTQIELVDISGILSAVAINDYVGIRLTQSTAGHNVDILGVLFVYT